MTQKKADARRHQPLLEEFQSYDNDDDDYRQQHEEEPAEIAGQARNEALTAGRAAPEEASCALIPHLMRNLLHRNAILLDVHCVRADIHIFLLTSDI